MTAAAATGLGGGWSSTISRASARAAFSRSPAISLKIKTMVAAFTIFTPALMRKAVEFWKPSSVIERLTAPVLESVVHDDFPSIRELRRKKITNSTTNASMRTSTIKNVKNL